ncbi:MAG: glycosyltransferase family 4 protein [Thermodesulfobacteriota bacterium]
MSKYINKILLTVPCLQDQGGVASFYNSVSPHFADGEITLLEIGGARNYGWLLHPLFDQINFWRSVKSVKPALIQLNPSLGLKSFIRDGLFAWQAKKMGYPLLVFWHGWDKKFEDEIEKKFMWFFHKSFGQADGFIVLASEFKRKLREWGVTASVYQETTSVDESLIAGIDVQRKWADHKRLSTMKILFLARLEREKGVFETVDALKILQRKGLDVSLTIAGDGPVRQELAENIKKLQLPQGSIRFLGYVQDKEKIKTFFEHDIYCFPTFYGEGLPTSVLEAMAFGMPVVTRPVGGLADIFEDGKMGALAYGKGPEEVADCIEKIIVDRDKMAKIGRYNAAYAKEHFMASVVSTRLQKIYEEILNNER